MIKILISYELQKLKLMSLQTAQFILPVYHKGYRLDISDKQGGLLVSIKSYLPSRVLSSHNTPSDIQVILFELNQNKERSIFMCIYSPSKQSSQFCFKNLWLIAFMIEILIWNQTVLHWHHLCNHFFNLIKANKFFNGLGSFKDLILTNRKYCFKHSSVFETGLSDHHHHFVYSMLKHIEIRIKTF